MTTMTTAPDVIALESAHVLQVYRRAAGGVRARQRCAVCSTRPAARTSISSPASACRRSGTGTRDSWRRSPRRRRSCSTRRTCSSTRCRASSRRGSAALSGLPRAFFCNSGAEAVEASLEVRAPLLARAGRAATPASSRWSTRSTAGRSARCRRPGTSTTARRSRRSLPDVTFVAPDDPGGARSCGHRDRRRRSSSSRSRAKAASGRCRRRWRRRFDDACAATGALLVADEVQCGLGRTGVPFYSSVLGLEPDVMALGKALGAGVPIGAAMLSERVAAKVSFGDHGSTYGGNLLACRAALVFLDELTGGLMAHVERTGRHLEEALRQIAARARVRARRPRRRRDVGTRARSAGRAGRRGGARSWAADQPDRGYGASAAAAVRHLARRTSIRWWSCCRRQSPTCARRDAHEGRGSGARSSGARGSGARAQLCASARVRRSHSAATAADATGSTVSLSTTSRPAICCRARSPTSRSTPRVSSWRKSMARSSAARSLRR